MQFVLSYVCVCHIVPLLLLSNIGCVFSFHDIFLSTEAIESKHTVINNTLHSKNNNHIYDEDVLPIWATDSELNKKYLRSSVSNFPQQDTPLANLSFHVPAEFEPISAVVLVYEGANDLFSEIKRQLSVSIADAGSEVWMIGGPKKGIPGVPHELYRQLDFDYDSTWVRDYGPIGITTTDNGRGLAIVDTTYRWYFSRKNDDAIPCKIANFIKAPCFHSSLILDGGNAMFDGNGNFFMTVRTYEWNIHLSKEEVDDKIRTYFSIHTIHSFEYALATPTNKFYSVGANEPADGTGHIDMFAKIVSPCVVIISTEVNEYEPMHNPLEKAADYFSTLSCTPSKTGYYQVFRICGWFDVNNSIWYTYTNSLIVNDMVIIPSYNDAQKCDDISAIQAYMEALPVGKNVTSINTDEPIKFGGSVHCLSRNIPKIV